MPFNTSPGYLLNYSAIVLFTLMLPGCASILTGEEEISVADLPDNIRTLIEMQVGEGQLTEIEREGFPFFYEYEVEYVKDGVEWEMEINSDGAIESNEPDD